MFKIFTLILTLFFVTSTLSSQEMKVDELKYTFKRISNSCMNINVDFLGDPSGETQIIIPWDHTAI